MQRGTQTGEVFIAASNQSKDLHLVVWTGTTMSTAHRIARDLHGSPQNEAFMIAGQARKRPLRIARWREVPNPDHPGL